jgi:hypothetical protein
MKSRSYEIPMQVLMDVCPPSGGTKKILKIPSILSKKEWILSYKKIGKNRQDLQDHMD